MIHGITASYVFPVVAASSDEILYADFQAGTYRLNGADVAVTDLFAGIDPALHVDPSAGLIVRFSNTCRPVATTALRDAIMAQLETGISVDVEAWQQGAYGGEVCYITFSETGDSYNDTKALIWEAGDTRSTVYNWDTLLATYDLGGTVRYPGTSAATINHRIDAAQWRSAATSEGSLVDAEFSDHFDIETVSAKFTPVAAIQFFHDIYFGSLNNIAEGAFRRIRITKPVADSVLEARGVSPNIPTLSQLAPAAGDVALLVHFDGNQGDTTAVDSSSYAQALTFSAYTTPGFIDQAAVKFGTGAYKQDKDGQSVVVTGAAGLDYDIGKEPFSIDTWFNIAAGVGNEWNVLCGKFGYNASGTRTHSWWIEARPTYFRLGWDTGNGSLTNISSIVLQTADGWDAPEGVFHHLQVGMNAFGRVRVRLNGQLLYAQPRDIVPYAATGFPFCIGAGAEYSGTWSATEVFRGHIDEFRMCLGFDPFDFDGHFAVPASPYV